MAVNETIAQTKFSAPGPVPRNASIIELDTALKRLEAMRSNVNNCNCAPSNCCQACQSCQTATCQSCQSCQKQCNCDCNCDCNQA